MSHRRVLATIAAAAIGALVALVSVQKHDAREAVAESVNGELVVYEVSSRTLTLRTATGDRYFIVPEGTPLHEGARVITVTDLTSASGCPAKIWYRNAEGPLIAREVRISCAALVSRDRPLPPGQGEPARTETVAQRERDGR